MHIFPRSLQEAGLKEGDYIISVNGKDCKWSKHAEVVQLLKSTGKEGVDIGVITLQGSECPKAVSHIPQETTEFLGALWALPWLYSPLHLSQPGGQEGSSDVLGIWDAQEQQGEQQEEPDEQQERQHAAGVGQEEQEEQEEHLQRCPLHRRGGQRGHVLTVLHRVP